MQGSKAIRLAGGAVLAAALAASAVSCQKFFTSSLAEPLARSSYTLPADISNADAIDLLAIALENGDQELAGALMDALLANIEGLDPADVPADVAEALFDAAVASSGIGSPITELSTTLISGGEPTQGQIDSLFAVTLPDGGVEALGAILDAPGTVISEDDCYIAVAVLTVSLFDSIGLDPDATATPEQQAVLDLLDSYDPAVAPTPAEALILAAHPEIALANAFLTEADDIVALAGGESTSMLGAAILGLMDGI